MEHETYRRVAMNDIVKKILDESRSIQDADFLPSIFGECLQEVLEKRTPVVLFGAGSAGQHLFPALQLHGVSATCFCDNGASRVGSTCCGIPVISGAELLEKHRESVIFVTSNRYAQEIVDQLCADGFSPSQIRRIDPTQLFYYVRFPHYHAGVEELVENQDAIDKAYELLSDEKSKKLFISRMALYAQGADYGAFMNFISRYSDALDNTDLENAGRMANRENFLYFNNDLIQISEGEVLVDGGAFTGDSAEEFIRLCKARGIMYSHLYCFEPDASNYNRLKENLSAHSDITCFNVGLWNRATALSFLSSGHIQSFAARVIRDSGDTEVVDPQVGDVVIRTTSIDEKLSGKVVTFIKMDIEGAEIEALEGGAETIRAHRPKLAISAYHRRSDLYRIPILINKIIPGYHFYLRHLSDCYYDTVLFAINNVHAA
jgi:FkbM family methyltransferase